MENELCRSRTTRWADVEAEEDDLDMSLPLEKTRSSNVAVTNSTFATDILNDKADTNRRKYNNRQNNNAKNDGAIQSNQGNSFNNGKRNMNLPREPPFLARISNLDYTLQLRDIQDFFKSKNIFDVKIKLPTRNGNNEGVATVEFEKFDDFSNFVNNFDGSCIGSRNIRVNVISQKNKLEDRVNHRNNNIIRGNNNSQVSTNHSQGQSSSYNQNNSNYNKGNKAHNHSNRDMSPDFSIVRRMNNNDGSKSDEANNKLETITSATDENKSIKSKTNSRPRVKLNENQGSNTLIDSINSNNEPNNTGNTSKSFSRNSVTTDSDKGNIKRWNFSGQKERNRFKQSGENIQYRNIRGGGKGGNNTNSKTLSAYNNSLNSNIDRTEGNLNITRELNNVSNNGNNVNGNSHNNNNNSSHINNNSSHNGNNCNKSRHLSITRSTNGREANEIKKGRGHHNNRNNGNIHSLENKLISGSKNKVLGPKGNNIETRNRFAALDES